MYKEYFGLTEAPFSIAPDPRYLYLSDKHREALAHLIYGVGDQGGFVLLTGEVGTGKTTVCRCLLQQIPEKVDIAFIIHPKLSANQLLQSIFTELGLSYQKGMTTKDLIDSLNEYLLEAHSLGRNTILIIDEAQNLEVEILEQLRLLTNLETNEKKLLQLVLIGQPELNDLLDKKELRQLAQRVTARYHLTPLSKPEVTNYIQHRLSVAGCRDELFPKSSINRIYQLTKGVPRLINLLCGRTLLGIYATNGSIATRKIINNAAKEIFPSKQLKAKPWQWLSLACIAGLLIFSASVAYKNQQVDTPAAVAEENQSSSQQTEETTKASIVPTDKLLTKAWGADAANLVDANGCKNNYNTNLYCSEGNITTEDIITNNVPAAIYLADSSLLVKSRTENTLLVDDGDKEFTLTVSELDKSAPFKAVWLTRLPDKGSWPINPGEAHPALAIALSIASDFINTTPKLVVDSEQSTKGKLDLIYSHLLQFEHSGLIEGNDLSKDHLVIFNQAQQKLNISVEPAVTKQFIQKLLEQYFPDDPILSSTTHKIVLNN